MPGSVANAAPVEVMPRVLCRAFTAGRAWLCDENLYRNGESQRRARVATSRKSWQVSPALSAAQWDALLDFMADRRHGWEPFFFYDPFQPASGQAVGSNYDATGVSTQGRYTVVLRGSVEAELSLPRGTVNVQLVEVG